MGRAGGRMRRGEVWWADLPPPVKPRPVVILTRDQVVATIGSLVVCIVTRSVRGIPTEVQVGRAEGLPVPCVANLDNILTVPKPRLVRRMGALAAHNITELNSATKFALQLE